MILLVSHPYPWINCHGQSNRILSWTTHLSYLYARGQGLRNVIRRKKMGKLSGQKTKTKQNEKTSHCPIKSIGKDSHELKISFFSPGMYKISLLSLPIIFNCIVRPFLCKRSGNLFNLSLTKGKKIHSEIFG